MGWEFSEERLTYKMPTLPRPPAPCIPIRWKHICNPARALTSCCLWTARPSLPAFPHVDFLLLLQLKDLSEAQRGGFCLCCYVSKAVGLAEALRLQPPLHWSLSLDCGSPGMSKKTAARPLPGFPPTSRRKWEQQGLGVRQTAGLCFRKTWGTL